jgi:predicted phage baseplate assembly protein
MLPSPNLDDRRFQDLVDDAKRLVAQYCPEWTDHNVSDPGITLIESFAFMVDQLFYRLNRVPDRLYVAFLELLGVTLHPPTAAEVDVLMWLSAPQPDTVVIPQGTEVSTRRTEEDEAVVFATTRELAVPPRRLDYVMTQGHGGVPVPHTEALHGDGEFACFGTPPLPGDVLLLGLNDQAPSCAVGLRFECEVRGVGVDPSNPPLVWEAWDGAGWATCELDSDGTGGLNRPGDVVLHVPHTHAASLLGGVRAGWLRCRVVDPTGKYPPYSASPTGRSAHAFTIGGTVPAAHAETITDEVIGMSEGVPGQSFELERRPVVPGGEAFVVEVAAGSGWDAWTEVDSFAGCSPRDRVIAVDRSAGIVHFPPAVRGAGGSLRAARYGFRGTAPAGARRATLLPGPCLYCGPASRSSTVWRTAGPPTAASLPKRSNRPSSGDRWHCGPVTGPSPARTTSNWRSGLPRT